MRLKILSAFILIILVYIFANIINAAPAYAGGQFECISTGFNTCITSTANVQCTGGDQPLLPIGETCEEAFQKTGNCPLGLYDCRPAAQNFFCTPNAKFCDPGGRLKTCNSSGTGAFGPAVDCSATGKVCVQNAVGAHCEDPANPQPPPQQPQSPCMQNCLQQGNTPGECNAACAAQQQPQPNQPLPNNPNQPFPNQPNQPGGQIGGGQPPIIDINKLIAGIGGNINQLKSVGAILSQAIKFIFAVAGFGLLIFLIRCGFQYLTSGGNPKQMEAAKQCITATIIGFVVIITAFWLTQIADYIFRLDAPF